MLNWKDLEDWVNLVTVVGQTVLFWGLFGTIMYKGGIPITDVTVTQVVLSTVLITIIIKRV